MAQNEAAGRGIGDDRENWAGTYTFAAERIEHPTSVEDVVRLVRESDRVHAVGTRHSFTDLPDTTGTLLQTDRLEFGPVLDEHAGTVTVGAGIRYGVLAEWLHGRGWALHNMGSLPHISVAGAVATGTHGSGDGLGILSAAVSGLEFVAADGSVVSVDRTDPSFAGLVVGVGAFGSVSVFTRWGDTETDSFWLKSRIGRDGIPPERIAGARIEAEGDVVPASVTQRGGVPGPWSLRLPHFRLDSTPSIGEELQAEYYVAREHAVPALRAVRELADRIDPVLEMTELRTTAADDLWLSGSFGRETFAIAFTFLRRPAEVYSLLPAIEEALRPFDARPHWGKAHLFDAARIVAAWPRAVDARALFDRLDPRGAFVNAHLQRLGLR